MNKKPMVLVFAGPNGSGKSTITQYFEKVGIYTNADEIVAATGMSNKEAAAFVLDKRISSINAKEDFTFETVLSSHYNLDILKKAKEKGFFIKSKSLKNIQELINICDILHVYDNTIEPKRIIRKHKEYISFFPNELWTLDKIQSLLGDLPHTIYNE